MTTVTARLTNNASQRVETRFIADDSTAQITATKLTVTQDNAVADGNASNHVQAVVTDANNNPLADQTVTFTADNGATVITVIGTTTAEGIASTTLTNTNAEQTIVTARLDNNASQSVKITFAQDLSIVLETTANNDIAGEESNTVKARVVNALGNPVANVKVDFSSVESGVTLSPSSGTTDSNGEISSSVSRSQSTGVAFAVIANVSEQTHNDTSTVNFLTLRTVSSIGAPYGHTFPQAAGFPTTGYPGAKFQINANGNAASNINYTWNSTDDASAAVDNEGNITLAASSLNKMVSITAKDNTYAYRYTFKVTRLFSRLSGNLKTFNDTQDACMELGMHVADAQHLTQGQNIRGTGSSWSEWVLPTGWPGGDINTAYWTRTNSAPGKHYLVILRDGSKTEKTPSGSYIEYGVCTQSE
ncbi:Ig-like domain-containing protein [Candidatus Symbiopectobacterium sp. PLON1]|uniref:Ig-like domain-containing protein n=1 Tax=Candidatus Symbiopectobacterium sp. PLON1 TaxID=2794575 RepID=UPI0025BA7DC2|nr:Ig-like domain-containing protein [Candidatus Symbiopectobacterium sp. PLON1]